METHSEKKNEGFSLVGYALHVGFAICTIVLVCVAGGIWLDRYFGTLPLFLLSGVVLSLIASAYEVLRIIKSIQIKK
ncbi:MAG: hypothetical protein A2934_04920 [Candidatus Sungbacteria bacterium RIFCSPLOWO2_01_FULL_47_10]|uniref:F0F1-ATPase subunit n=1 Tax=Candidatus Sungbacteria bacterium RIFCSPLOWO2_01_FULL_47_10 TaxID=1802276 RepID=A0A1G2L2A1_9BACT|nr:MAG: hypothetical protein A2934_04920 [Candidatus Sungbacteria bacterium RIFCSPLOWO2_01_FULL_47_10]